MFRSLPLLVLFSSSCLLAVDAGSNAGCLPQTGSSCDGGSLGTDAGASSADGLPAVMLLVDISGSMNSPLSFNGPTCGTCTGATCPPTCPTRRSVLIGGLGQMLQSQATTAWLGLTTFPDGANTAFMPSGCAPATVQAVPLAPVEGDAPSAVLAQRQAVLSAVEALGSAERPFSGGTPTAPSLRFLASLPALTASTRPRGVILVTDGLANCNPNNALSCDSSPRPASNLCTLGANCIGPYCRAGYLDNADAVLAVRALRTAGVKVAVIGLGADFDAPESVQVMNALADEGGATACAPGLSCDKRFFAVNNEALLFGALATAMLRVTQ
ncbi:MAG: VWA domain-containing protein [Myxococcaceae bacterium]